MYKYSKVALSRTNSTISESALLKATSGDTSSETSDTSFCSKYKTILFLTYFVCYTTYLLIGAAVFNRLETPEEQALVERIRGVRERFLKIYPNVSDDDLELLISEVVHASNRGVTATKNATGEPNWSFGQSFFFASTVVTTVGYGHVTPLSRVGKIFCMLYAVVGIPLTLVLLSALVERLLIPTLWFLQFLNSRLGHLYQPFKIRLIHLFVIVVILLTFFMLIPAAIFAAFEPEWDYLDSIYYCFISLTTIGLGDYIPGDTPAQPHRPIYKIATTGYLFLGITFMMLTMTVFYEIPQLNLGLLFSNIEEVNSEKVLLSGPSQITQYGAGNVYSSKYEGNTHRHVVRVRSRRDDSPSPDETPKEVINP